MQYEPNKPGCANLLKSVNMEEVFFYFGDVLCTEVGVQEAVTMRIRSG